MSLKLDNVVSLERAIAAGIPQGSVLGPLLISGHVSMLPRLPEVQLVMLPNDTAVYTVNH